MKKLLLTACLCFMSLSVFAQVYKEPARDTLVVTKVLYQMSELPEEEWPCTEIYRNHFGFVIMDEQYDLVERKEYGSAVFYKLNLYGTKEYFDMWLYESTGDVQRYKLGDYQLYCKNMRQTPYLKKVDQKPTFEGGDMNTFSKWVNKRLVYPEKAKKEGTQGRVTLQFKVNKDGEVCDICVVRGVSPELDKEAYDVVSKSPKWTPAIHEGKPVSVTITFPVIFQLR